MEFFPPLCSGSFESESRSRRFSFRWILFLDVVPDRYSSQWSRFSDLRPDSHSRRWGCRTWHWIVVISSTELRPLQMLYPAEGQVDARLRDTRSLGTSFLKFFWVLPAIISRLPYGSLSEKATTPPFPLSRERRSAPRLTDAMTGRISCSASVWRPTLSFPLR